MQDAGGRPQPVRVRLEFACAFFLKEEDSLARQHFEQVLAGRLPVGVALNVNRILAQTRVRKRWAVRVGVALTPDSNILIDTPFGRLPFNYQGDEPKSGIGIAVWAGGEYQYPLSPRWRPRSGADLLRRECRSDEFGRMTISAHLGPRWVIGRTCWRACAIAGSPTRPTSATSASASKGQHRLGRPITASFNASRYERRYEGRHWLGGPVTDLSTGGGWAATPAMRIDAALGWGQLGGPRCSFPGASPSAVPARSWTG